MRSLLESLSWWVMLGHLIRQYLLAHRQPTRQAGPLTTNSVVILSSKNNERASTPLYGIYVTDGADPIEAKIIVILFNILS